ncbi:MAG: DNA repair protein RecO [Parcubacteria group bacterium]|nr:DNA repair protein RecO [Parcubacteria group bacterium]
MSYQLYKTDAIVLSSYDTGEAHRTFELLTEELGFVRATARSIREEKSKLRYSLQDLSVSNISLVRGKEVWRITGANEGFNIYHALKHDSQKERSILRVVSLVRRLVHGEEQNRELYEIVRNAVSFLQTSESCDEADDRFEILTVLRILYNLGYLARRSSYEKLLDSIDLNTELISSVTSVRRDLIESINTSLSESHL